MNQEEEEKKWKKKKKNKKKRKKNKRREPPSRMVFILLHFLSLLPLSQQALNLPLISSNSNANRTNVVWMVPSWVCTGEDYIEVEKYGVKQNQDQKFTGGQVFAIFYEHSFGKIPYFKGQDVDKPMNGGLPQMGDLSAHLIEAEKNINETIPDEKFDGIAVIDIEEFRPMWKLSWGAFTVYKTESIRLVRQQYPYWSPKQIEWQAEKDYEKACQKFFIETIRLGRRLRPKAKWGYYLFPKCNGDVGQKQEGTECSQLFQRFNDDMNWLWVESTALFPSIYLYPKHKSIPDFNYINTGALITETRRVKRTYCPHCEIHIFTKIENPAPYNYLCRCERPFFGKSCEFRARRLGFSMPRTVSLDDFDRYNAANQFYAFRNGTSSNSTIR
uniref:Hyaluronidase n=1 Tax=Caenorhabditis japonica TaxID=281687 RepID=A0A8R1IDB4_CAEJA